MIKLLLDYGARVNVLDNDDQSPLLIAIKKCAKYNRVAVKSLLAALVFSDHPMRKFYPQMDCPFDQFSPLHVGVNNCQREQSEENLQRVQLLLKYVLLKRLRLCYRTFHVCCKTKHKMLDFDDLCKRELQSVCVKPDVTLAQFILRSRLQEDEEECQTDEILEILNANVYPIYKEVVSGLLSRNELKNGFQHHVVSAAVSGGKQSKTQKRVVLDYDSICILMKYLSDEDLLNLLLAFHVSNKNIASPIALATPTKMSLDEIDFESERFFKRARIN